MNNHSGVQQTLSLNGSQKQNGLTRGVSGESGKGMSFFSKVTSKAVKLYLHPQTWESLRNDSKTIGSLSGAIARIVEKHYQPNEFADGNGQGE